MANPRQRRKAKSSTRKTISHSKRAKRLQKKMPTIRGPKALQDAWDPCKTLRQNYLALALQHDLNPIPSGGSEINLTRIADQINPNQPHPVTSTLSGGFGRIVRDSSGNVVRVELPNDEETGHGHASKSEVVIDPPAMTRESELRIWACDSCQGGPGSTGGIIVRDLENLAAATTVHERHTSMGERLYLERLVIKYGDDFDKMGRDRRLNLEQRTANELRKAIAKAGVTGAQCNHTVAGVAA